MRGDARQERLGNLDRRQLALAVKPVQLGDRQKSDIHFGHPRQPWPFNRTRPMPAMARAPNDLTQQPGSGSNARQPARSEEHTSELQSRFDLVCRLLLETKT